MKVFNLLIFIGFSSLTFASTLKKNVEVDTTIFYQEGIYEYELNLSQNTVFDFGIIHPNSALEKVIVHVRNDTDDTLYFRKLEVTEEIVKWKFQPFDKIAPREKIEMKIELLKLDFISFENSLTVQYHQNKSKKTFFLTTKGSLMKGNASISLAIPPKIQLNRLAGDSLERIQYNGEWYNEFNEKGYKQGKWVYFYEDGTLKELIEFNNGYKVGEHFAYYSAGNLRFHSDYVNHADVIYSESGPKTFRVVPDSVIYYHPSGKRKQVTTNGRNYFFDENGYSISNPKDAQFMRLSDYFMVLNSSYHPNGNVKMRKYLSGITIYYDEKERDCIVKIQKENNSKLSKELNYSDCQLDEINTFASLSDSYLTAIKCVKSERGEFKNDTLINGFYHFISDKKDTLYSRKVVNRKTLSAIYLKGEVYNQTDSLGRKQGEWIYNNQGSQSWSDYGHPIIYQKFTYRNDTIQHPFYHFYVTGQVRQVYYGEVAKSKPNEVGYSKRGNVIYEKIGEIYYGYADSTKRIQTAYNNGSKFDFTFKNGNLTSRTSPKQEDYYSMEMPVWRTIPYTVSEGSFQNYHLYNGTINYYSERGVFLKSQKVVNGAINGDRILVFKDLAFENELLESYSVDRDKNGYITVSEALKTQSLFIRGLMIKDVSDFIYFKNLKSLNLNHIKIDPSSLSDSKKLLSEVKKAQSIPYVAPDRGYGWNDYDLIVPEMIEIEIQDPIYDFPEEEAYFPGGQDSLKAYFKRNMRYPATTQQNSVKGTVYVKFVINEDGSITSLRLLRGVTKELDDEAMRLIREMPKWIPAKNQGKNVKSYFTLPVRFSL